MDIFYPNLSKDSINISILNSISRPFCCFWNSSVTARNFSSTLACCSVLRARCSRHFIIVALYCIFCQYLSVYRLILVKRNKKKKNSGEKLLIFFTWPLPRQYQSKQYNLVLVITCAVFEKQNIAVYFKTNKYIKYRVH